MVHLTATRYGIKKTFGLMTKGRYYNHRRPVKYHRFQSKLDPDEILAHYSREDIDEICRDKERTYKDAQTSMGRKTFLLPNLSDQDLEINDLYQKELDRQRAIVARINKIKVIVDSAPGKGTEMYMNRDISTPYDCARHIHELLTTRTVVAELSPMESSLQIAPANDETSQNSLSKTDEKPKQTIYWDMHRPLQADCHIKFRHFSEKDVNEVNKIYWRSCSFVLGMALRLAFKSDIKVLLHSWPKPNVRDGSFVYDAALNLTNKWEPAEQELRAFTKIMWRIKGAELPFDYLKVDRDVARKLFANNAFKLAQIDSILENASKITVYRCGGLLDMSVGPMISNTGQIGRITLAAVHPFESQSDQFKGVFYRFQGVSLPQQLPISSYLYQNVLINQAKKLNKVAL